MAQGSAGLKIVLGPVTASSASMVAAPPLTALQRQPPSFVKEPWTKAPNGRNYPDWLQAFCDYAQFGEAPRKMHFWAGVSALAGCLRRKVWIDQAYFKWFPNFYIVIVAPPGIVSKSTTAGVAMNLLRQVPGIKFGPEIATWQALAGAFVESAETFEYNGEQHIMSPITIESSEFGNLLDPSDKGMVDILVTLWDGKALDKRTKSSGNDNIENPWINVIACTTPSWVAGNFPEYMIGGGFVSRCLFVYAEHKAKYVAYPGLAVPKNLDQTAFRLIEDLEHIANKLAGPYVLTREAVKWGEAWYREHYTHKPEGLDDERFGGYIARKQTHMHKLAIILAAAQRDELVITDEDLITAHAMITELEKDMPMVFSKIGKSEDSNQADRFIAFIQKAGEVEYAKAYRYIHSYFPGLKDFENIVIGAIKAGYIRIIQKKDPISGVMSQYLVDAGKVKGSHQAEFVKSVAAEDKLESPDGQ